MAVLAQHERLPDRAMPLTDAELSALVAVRDQAWHQRSVLIITPTNRETHPESWALAYVVDWKGDWHIKTPGAWLPDYVKSESCAASRQVSRRHRKNSRPSAGDTSRRGRPWQANVIVSAGI